MNRCYVCNASQHDSCQAIGGEIAECPRPSRSAPQALMVEEARKALEAFGRGDMPGYDLHRFNARRIANELGLQARRPQPEAVPA